MKTRSFQYSLHLLIFGIAFVSSVGGVKAQFSASSNYKIISKHSGKCLDIPDGSIGNNIIAQQFDCHGENNQQWKIIPDGNGYYTIKARHSGKCLDVWDAATGNNARIQQYDCHGGNNQKWQIISDGSSYYTMKAKHSNKCWDIYDASTANQAKLQQFDCHGGNNQKWRIEQVSEPTSSTVRLKLRTLVCNKTTEAGADEVYVLVIGNRSDGAKYTARIPADAPHSAAGHWDMNDGNQPTDNPSGDSRRITNKQLFIGDVSPGQRWDVVILIMEEDGGNSKKWQEAASAAAIESGNPYAIAGGVILATFTKLFGGIVNDTDDYIGSFAVSIANNGGNVTTDWRAIDRVSSSQGAEEREFGMNGDGSAYIGTYGVFR